MRTRIPAWATAAVHWLSIGLLTAGCCGMAAFIWAGAEARVYQEVQEAFLAEPPEPAAGPAAAVQPEAGPAKGDIDEPALPVRMLRTARWARDPAVLGRLEIPRAGVNVVVREGLDARTLRIAAGHLPGSALPGEGGNSVIAAHRDTFFRRLRHVRRGDRLKFVTSTRTLEYVVDSLSVVTPQAAEVLEPTSAERFTLITCFPFDYTGPAPRRFIVTAARRH